MVHELHASASEKAKAVGALPPGVHDKRSIVKMCVVSNTSCLVSPTHLLRAPVVVKSRGVPSHRARLDQKKRWLAVRKSRF